MIGWPSLCWFAGLTHAAAFPGWSVVLGVRAGLTHKSGRVPRWFWPGLLGSPPSGLLGSPHPPIGKISSLTWQPQGRNGVKGEMQGILSSGQNWHAHPSHRVLLVKPSHRPAWMQGEETLTLPPEGETAKSQCERAQRGWGSLRNNLPGALCCPAQCPLRSWSFPFLSSSCLVTGHWAR